MFLQMIFLSIVAFAGAAKQEFLPQGECEQVIAHQYYTLCYSDKHRQAQWVIHKLTKESVDGPAKRKNNFRPDPFVEDPVTKDDYRDTGYDRGHLVPAGDMKYSATAMNETFFMSNISPQVPEFNQGIWNDFENKVRDWVRAEGDAYVVTAPVLEPKLKKVSCGISVPGWYYKIIYNPSQQWMVAYLMPNMELKDREIGDYKVTVDDLEAMTGLDFFSDLDDELEERLESML